MKLQGCKDVFFLWFLVFVYIYIHVYIHNVLYVYAHCFCRRNLYIHLYMYFGFILKQHKRNWSNQQKSKPKTRSFSFLRRKGSVFWGKNQSYENPTWVNEFFCPVSTWLSMWFYNWKKLPQTSWMDVGETFDTPSEKKGKHRLSFMVDLWCLGNTSARYIGHRSRKYCKVAIDWLALRKTTMHL